MRSETCSRTQLPPKIPLKNQIILLFIILSACTTEVEKVCKAAEEDNLQPFKDKMEDFLTQGKNFEYIACPKKGHQLELTKQIGKRVPLNN